jgi:cytochrome b subunit of formate dehydrogenase
MQDGQAFERIGRCAEAVACSVLLLLLLSPLTAQENDDCMMCHEDPELSGVRNGEEVSVYIDAASYANAVHAGLDCINCHQDLDGADLPHDDDVALADCSICHDSEAERHAGSLHGRAAARGDEMAPTCADCHGTHDIRAHREPDSPTATMNIPLLCGKCHREGSPVSRTHEIHQDNVLQNYSLSIHGEGLFKQGLSVTAVCTSCHTSHDILPHTDRRSSIYYGNITETCTQCHAQVERVHRKVIEGRLWEDEPGKIPVCVDCHSPHKIRRVFYNPGMANKDCLSCHGRPELTAERDGEIVPLYVDERLHNLSAHAGTACSQCHTEVASSATRSCETIVSKVDCSVCHAQQVQDHEASIHGALHAQADPDAPVCLDCHDKHATQSKHVPTSPTFAQNVPVLCARCHRAGESAALRIESVVEDIIQSYSDSIHGKGLLKSGLVVTATCTSCHSSHRELPSDDPGSTIHADRISDTCGTCHHGIEEIFKTSIHYKESHEQVPDLPTCEDCHTSHTITRADMPGFRTMMMEQCGRCHESEAETFFDTYHGKVSRLGAERAAKCYDCHGTHDILPTTAAASRLSRQNVVETCSQGNCHPGSHRRFTGYLTHATHHDPAKYPWLFWSFWGMTALLVGTLAFSLLHTVAWLIRLWLSREEWKVHKERAGKKDVKLYRRFGRLQRTMHIFMIISFFTLSLTGMSLKFSYMAWAQLISRALGGFETMGLLHRMGAVTLFVVFFVHLWDLLRKKRESGEGWIEHIYNSSSMFYKRRDFRQFAQSVRWFFGLGPRPHYHRYTYWEKFDYAAVFWGIAVIGSTGLILWFPEIFTRIIPGWFVNVATIIHSDEALLAVGFIFTIHFFNTHFRPDKFPIDPVIFTGRMTVEELKFDKPAEYEELVANGELEQHLVDPLPREVERGFKIFGFIALGVGLLLIALIVYAMLFGYR